MNKVYHVKTQEDYDELMKELEEKGYTWILRGKKPTEYNFWANVRKETCVALGEDKTLTYDTYGYFKKFKKYGYEITEYKATKKEKKAMKLEDVFTSECDSNQNGWGSQKFCTAVMRDKQSLYESALSLESRARNIRQRVLEDLEKAVAEERKIQAENVKQLDKALEGSEDR